MSENSNIYNIFSRLSNSNNIKEDLNEALCLIEKHFKHKYLTPIEQIFVVAHKIVHQNLQRK